MKKRRQRGFTLIEMIIVIAVITILIGIGLPRLRGMIEEGNVGKGAGELKVLQVSVESYYIHNAKTYPAAGGTWQNALVAARPQVLGAVLNDPFATAGTPYKYGKSPNGLYYVVWSVGVNGAADVTGIDDAGAVTGGPADDLYVDNGPVGSGGF